MKKTPVGKTVVAVCLAAVLAGSQGTILAANAQEAFTSARVREDASNATAVWKQEQALPDMKDAYVGALTRTKNLDTEKYVFENPFTGKDIVIDFGNRRQVEMQITKFVMPMQLKFAWDNAKVVATLTERQLEAAGMNLFAAILNAQTQVDVQALLVADAKDAFTRSEASYKAGRISRDEYDLASWTLQNAELDRRSADEDLASLQRQYLSTFGRDPGEELGVASAVFDGILPEGEADGYVKSALDTRWELGSIRAQLEIEEKRMEIYHFRDLYLLDSATIEDYRHASVGAEQLKAQLAAKRQEIEAEIRTALIDINSSRTKIAETENTLARQENRLSQLEAFYAAGRVTKATVTEMKTAVMQIRTGLAIAKQDLSNKCRRFSYATSYGPAY